METLETIFVSLIEGIKSYIPVMAKKITSNTYQIVSGKVFEEDDDTLLFQFLPGDTVICRTEVKRNQMGEEEKILVAESLVNSIVPERKYLMLRFIIADQNGQLTEDQQVLYRNELVKLKNRFEDGAIIDEHPSILRWLKS